MSLNKEPSIFQLSKDYERLPEMSEAAVYAVMTRIMLRRGLAV